MIDLILIIMLIISLAKPDVLLSKKIKERASDEQKGILANNYRKIYAILVGSFESIALIQYIDIIGIILALVCIILFFKFSLPAIKENKKIVKEQLNL